MGLMIVIATNLSSWLAAIVDETLMALEQHQYSHGSQFYSKFTITIGLKQFKKLNYFE